MTEVERVELGEVAEGCWRTVETRTATIEVDTARVIQADTS
ncbi:MAG: hypothetical protein J07HX64_01131 [halophilic archaeon J07HX64]|nr:MAG: hypothetical protein J07HX64_01131 [halophilic archaeon J07HX64]